MLGVVVDSVTTMLGFGLLAFSSHPAMFAIGITAGIGVTLCLTFALCFAPLVTSAAPRS
jgi:predicted exporter